HPAQIFQVLKKRLGRFALRQVAKFKNVSQGHQVKIRNPNVESRKKGAKDQIEKCERFQKRRQDAPALLKLTRIHIARGGSFARSRFGSARRLRIAFLRLKAFAWRKPVSPESRHEAQRVCIVNLVLSNHAPNS